MRGSRKHMLDWIDAVEFPAALTEIVRPAVRIEFSRESPHMPTGRADPREARLENWRPSGVGSDAIWRELDAWWLAASRGASTPNWDFAARVTVDGSPGFILVEAKANVRELSAGGAKTAPTTSQGSIANDTQIRAALLEASIGLSRYAPSVALSTNHAYQLSNRMAFAWKLASMGIPTVLLYLGFTGDRDIADVSEPLRDAAHWQKLVSDYADTIGIKELFEKRLDLAAPMWALVRARHVA